MKEDSGLKNKGNGHGSHGKRLHMGRMQPATGARQHLFIDLPAGTEPNDLLDPGYWAHYSQGVRPSDLLEVFCEDGSWEGLYRVMFVSSAEVKIVPIYVSQHGDAGAEGASDSSDTHHVVWKGPTRKYAVARKDSGEVIKDALYPKSEAFQYMHHHLASLRG